MKLLHTVTVAILLFGSPAIAQTSPEELWTGIDCNAPGPAPMSQQELREWEGAVQANGGKPGEATAFIQGYANHIEALRASKCY